MLGPDYLSVAGLCARSGFRPGPCGVKIARPDKSCRDIWTAQEAREVDENVLRHNI